MQIKIHYSKNQLDDAVSFISENNKSFIGEDDLIRNTIINSIAHISEDPNLVFTGTMGYMLVADREFESIDNDENYCRIEILVDPSLASDDNWYEDDSVIQTVTTTRELEWEM